jgi:hypothetical protein
MSLTKDSLIAEIRRTAGENAGFPLGEVAFRRETGIAQSSWRGVFWRKWGDALQEAGFAANKKNEPFDSSYLIFCLAELTRKIGHFPTYADTRMEKRVNERFPGAEAILRLGTHEQRLQSLREFVTENVEWHDLLAFFPPSKGIEPTLKGIEHQGTEDGFVYLALLKIGTVKCYKIGKTNLVERRRDQLSIQLPEDLQLIHVIRTDDPNGIERYWHARFADKRSKGEWFRLTRVDIDAFKRRKFM